jgi:hypothetical protein
MERKNYFFLKGLLFQEPGTSWLRIGFEKGGKTSHLYNCSRGRGKSESVRRRSLWSPLVRERNTSNISLLLGSCFFGDQELERNFLQESMKESFGRRDDVRMCIFAVEDSYVDLFNMLDFATRPGGLGATAVSI